jgi:hypothetical protein
MIPTVFWHGRSNHSSLHVVSASSLFNAASAIKESKCSLPLSWLIIVDQTGISLTSVTAFFDHSHLVLECATSDTEQPALVQLPTQASACVFCIYKFEECV